MIKYISPILLLLFLSTTFYAQDINFTALLIPKELKENANAVVRDNSIEISIEDVNKMTVKRRKVVTVLNKLGDVDAIISESYDLDTKIKDLSAIIYDAFGNEIRKYSERKFEDISAVSGGTLYSDSRVKYIDYTPVSYPYTLVFESEYVTETTGFIPWFFPVNGYFVSVQKSSYTLKNPKEIPFRKKEMNFESYMIKTTSSPTELTYILENEKALKHENSSVHYREILPKALVTLDKFYLKGVYGEYSNWNEFGKWMNEKLLTDRDILEEPTKLKIRKLVKGIEDPIERAKLVYQFMQNKTRYISVQVGIGGWEPIAANQVDKVGYGDCKGLTNYTKALMGVANVTSYYTIVYADEKQDIDKEFSSIQGNHIILNIPNKGNDIWLECTSQTMPFGFLGDFTEDRDVLVVTPEGGIIKRTPAYKNEKNLQITKATINFDEVGNLKATLKRTSEGIQYDDKFGYDTFSDEELIKNYKSNVWSYNNNLEVTERAIKNDKDSIKITENLKINISDFATVDEKEYLFRVNVFNAIDQVPKRYRKRNLPLQITRGFKDVDEYTIKIPSDFLIGNLPEKKVIKTPFGSYDMRISKVDEGTLQYKRTIIILAGTHPKEEYEKYRSFRKIIAKSENLRIALAKK
jgi:transglutaminase-like putative cysteine protease